MIIDVIHNSFLLNESQKIYLMEQVKNNDEAYTNRLLKNLQSENVFLLQLLKKYKSDTDNISI